MKKNLILETDKKTAKEGEFIDIKWNCSLCPDSLYLILDSGHKTDRLPVADKGSTRIAVPHTKNKFIIRLVAMVGGKRISEELSIKVSDSSTGKQASKPLSKRFRLWKEKIYAGWCVFRAQAKYWWLSQKKWQKAIWIALLAFWLGLIIFSQGKPAEAESSTPASSAIVV